MNRYVFVAIFVMGSFIGIRANSLQNKNASLNATIVDLREKLAEAEQKAAGKTLNIVSEKELGRFKLVLYSKNQDIRQLDPEEEMTISLFLGVFSGNYLLNQPARDIGIALTARALSEVSVLMLELLDSSSMPQKQRPPKDKNLSTLKPEAQIS